MHSKKKKMLTGLCLTVALACAVPFAGCDLLEDTEPTATTAHVLIIDDQNQTTEEASTEEVTDSGNTKVPTDGGKGGGVSANIPTEVTYPLAAGGLAPDFTATLPDGGTFTLSDHRGEVVLLNFWATWCGPCVGEMPALEQIHNEGAATVIAVSEDDTEQDMTSFKRTEGYTMNMAFDGDGSLSSLYPSQYIPYTIIIDQNGVIAEIFTGADSADAQYNEYMGVINGLK